MNTEKIVMCIVALLLGMLLFHFLKGVFGCKTIEGAGTVGTAPPVVSPSTSPSGAGKNISSSAASGGATSTTAASPTAASGNGGSGGGGGSDDNSTNSRIDKITLGESYKCINNNNSGYICSPSS